jgi:hypothetical protein
MNNSRVVVKWTVRIQNVETRNAFENRPVLSQSVNLSPIMKILEVSIRKDFMFEGNRIRSVISGGLVNDEIVSQYAARYVSDVSSSITRFRECANRDMSHTVIEDSITLPYVQAVLIHRHLKARDNMLSLN